MAYTFVNYVLIAVALYLAKHVLLDRKHKLPPGPKGLPLIGNLFDMPKDYPWIHLSKYKEIYGPISSLTIFGQHIIVLNDESVSVDLLEKRSSIFSDRPKFTFAGKMCGWEEGLSLLPYNDQLRSFRKSAAQFLGSRSLLMKFHPLQEEQNRHFLKNVLDDPEKLNDHIRSNAGAIILKILYGYTISKHGGDPLVNLADNAMSQFAFATQPGLWMVDIIPALRWVPDWFPFTGFKRTARLWRKTLDTMVDVPYTFVKEQMAASQAKPSYVSHCLEGSTSPENEFIAKWTAFSLYAGGADTIVSAGYGFFLAMVLHPDVLKKAQAEIDSVVGNDALPTFLDRERLPYVDAIVKETLRWNSLGPFGVAHVASENDVYAGYFIPKGSILLPNIWRTHHDPQIYHDQEVFKPERFLGIDGRAPELDPHSYTFGYGRRICPGKDLADSSLWLTVAYSLAVFDISKARDEFGREITPVPEWTTGVISHPKEFKCSITARSSKAEALIRAVDDEYPVADSDAGMITRIMKSF